MFSKYPVVMAVVAAVAVELASWTTVVVKYSTFHNVLYSTAVLVPEGSQCVISTGVRRNWVLVSVNVVEATVDVVVVDSVLVVVSLHDVDGASGILVE
jgi:hypothetical protein